MKWHVMINQSPPRRSSRHPPRLALRLVPRLVLASRRPSRSCYLIVLFSVSFHPSCYCVLYPYAVVPHSLRSCYTRAVIVSIITSSCSSNRPISSSSLPSPPPIAHPYCPIASLRPPPLRPYPYRHRHRLMRNRAEENGAFIPPTAIGPNRIP